MGQYYRIAYKNNGKVYTNSRKVEGEGHMMAKLMEHSYFGNVLLDSVAEMLYNNKTKLAWIGDYADEDNEVEKATEGEVVYKDVWGEGDILNPTEFEKVKFSYKGKYLVNHDTKEYFSFDKYKKDSKINLKGWYKKMIPNPISILTVIGNGRGGGDYCGLNMKMVGKWIWNTLSIEDFKDVPKDYKKINLSFKEDWIVAEEKKENEK